MADSTTDTARNPENLTGNCLSQVLQATASMEKEIRTLGDVENNLLISSSASSSESEYILNGDDDGEEYSQLAQRVPDDGDGDSDGDGDTGEDADEKTDKGPKKKKRRKCVKYLCMLYRPLNQYAMSHRNIIPP